MAKDKNVKLLSPENYIRKKARTLPIYQCWINSSWEQGKMASIIIVRKHFNGNLTMGIFLVDLLCLGVKNTTYSFNIPDFEYDQFLKDLKEKEVLEAIDYKLAHNIIFSAIEFAEEFGFKPHKGFEIVKYILEEDDENIEIIEIECGIDGQPAVVRNPDNKAESDRVASLLRKSLGPDGYFELDSYEFENQGHRHPESSDDFFDESAETRLKELLLRKNNFTKKEDEEFVDLINGFFYQYLNPIRLEKLLEEFKDEFDVELNENYYDGILGLNYENSGTAQKIFKEITFLIRQLNKTSDTQKANKRLQSFKKKYGEIPKAVYAGLQILAEENEHFIFPDLDSALEKFPDYPMLKLFYLKRLMLFEEIPNDKEYLFDNLSISNIFNNRKLLHPDELNEFILVRFFHASHESDLEMLEALFTTLLDIKTDKEIFIYLTLMFSQYKINFANAELFRNE